MNDLLITRVRAAAVAGWWTLLAGVLFITFVWLSTLCIMANQPACVLRLWGPGTTWTDVHHTSLWAVTVFKLALWLLALLNLWLTLWARQLRKRAPTR